MISARSIFREIRADDEAYRFFLSLAAKGEDQGGFENARIAALTPDPVLAAKIARHGEDEAKHGRLFAALLRRRGLSPASIPLEADYCLRLEQAGVGLSHARLAADQPLGSDEVLAYLVHSRVTEQRGAEEVFEQRRHFGTDDELGKAIHLIADDEERHLAYCHEELLRLADAGHRERIEKMLETYARAECGIYQDMSRVVLQRMAQTLGWPAWKRWILLAGLRLMALRENVFTWRRLTRLEPPSRSNPMGVEPAPRGQKLRQPA